MTPSNSKAISSASATCRHTSLLFVLFIALLLPGCGEKTSPTVLKEIEALDSTSAKEREDALLHLADHKEKAKQAGPKAVELLNDDSAGVRVAAIKLIATSRFDTAEALAAIAALAAEEKDEGVRSEALNALLGLEAHEEHAEVCAKLLGSKEEGVREVAALGLAEAKDKAVVAETEILTGLKDKSAYVRMYCAMAIGNIGVDASDGAKKQLEALKNDKEEMVRDAVKEALGKLQ